MIPINLVNNFRNSMLEAYKEAGRQRKRGNTRLYKYYKYVAREAEKSAIKYNMDY